ncbi:hypothetical protein BpHYR1_044327 [Brachionus plicatilis]|uniref:Uncharacterized protein n=1 Tax=Brachionus plicatilis TaxID=10195 RepID=A0A3M7T6J1_BRAPC|nr:hypothetical protein BpHYR1_044327 [Brachionus plicatilis]
MMILVFMDFDLVNSAHLGSWVGASSINFSLSSTQIKSSFLSAKSTAKSSSIKTIDKVLKDINCRNNILLSFFYNLNSSLLVLSFNNLTSLNFQIILNYN